MKIIFHIGMGKTGTSSIQHALSENQAALASHKMRYLGMWFADLDVAYRGFDGLKLFFDHAEAEPEAMAQRFHDHCAAIAAKSGVETFILSNEGLFGYVRTATPFMAALRDLMEISLILYVRDPRAWLPSAYTQWGVRHKEQGGNVQPFADRARVLIGQYGGVRLWHRSFKDQLIAREHAKGLDVVQDFAEVINVPLDPPKERVLERAEDAEILLRALFNDRYRDPVLPERFNRIIHNSATRPAAEIDEMIARCFDMSALDDILAGAADDLGYLKEEVGLDFLSGREAPPAPDRDAIRGRLTDYLVEIMMQQGLRLQKLERQVRELED